MVQKIAICAGSLPSCLQTWVCRQEVPAAQGTSRSTRRRRVRERSKQAPRPAPRLDPEEPTTHVDAPACETIRGGGRDLQGRSQTIQTIQTVFFRRPSLKSPLLGTGGRGGGVGVADAS